VPVKITVSDPSAGVILTSTKTNSLNVMAYPPEAGKSPASD